GHDRGGEQAAHSASRGHFMREMVAEPGLLGQLDLDRLHRDQAAGGRAAEVNLPPGACAQAAKQRIRPDPIRIPTSQRLKCQLRPSGWAFGWPQLRGLIRANPYSSACLAIPMRNATVRPQAATSPATRPLLLLSA